jgi:hypothetical protein
MNARNAYRVSWAIESDACDLGACGRRTEECVAESAVASRGPIERIDTFIPILRAQDSAGENAIALSLLMMGFTKDGQADECMLADRDKRFDVSGDENRQRRADIAHRPVDPDADAWQKGIVMQVQVSQERGSEAR